MMPERGFTLLETIIYIAMVGLLIGGGVAAGLYIIDTSEKNRTDVNIQTEGLFLIGKIDWAITGATAVTEPAAGATDNVLEVTKTGMGVVRISVSSEQAELSVNGAPAVALTNDRVHVQSLQFTHAIETGKPPRIDAAVTIDGNVFSLKKYMRP